MTKHNYLTFLIILVFIYNSQAQQHPHLPEIERLDSLYSFYDGQGEYELALECAEKKASLRREIGKDSSYAHSLNAWADVAARLGLYDKAETLYKEALPILEKTFGKMHKDPAIIKNGLGVIQLHRGNYEQAIALLTESADIKKKIGMERSDAYTNTVSNLAYAYSFMGLHDKSEALYLEALDIEKEVLGQDSPDFASTLNNLALLYIEKGEYEKAEPLCVQATEIAKKAYGETHIEYAFFLNGLADINKQLLRYSRAIAQYQQVSEIIKNSLGETHPIYSTSLNNTAATIYASGDTEQGLALMNQSAALDKQIFGAEHPDYAITLTNLAVMAADARQYEKAADLHKEALKIREKVLGKTHPSYFFSLNHLSYNLCDLGDYNGALQCVKEAVRNNAKNLDSLPADLNTLLEQAFYSKQYAISSLAVWHDAQKGLALQTNDPKLLQEAYTAMQVALAMSEQVRNDFSGNGAKFKSLSKMNTLTQKAIQTGLLLDNNKNIENSFKYVEQNKSALLADALKANRARSLSDLPDSIVLKEADLQTQLDALNKQEAEAKTSTEKNEIAAAKTELMFTVHAFQQMLRTNFPRYHALQYDNITASVADVQALLDDKTLFLEYFVTDSLTYIFAITAKTLAMHPLPIAKEKLNEQVKQLRRALSDYNWINTAPDSVYIVYTQTAHWFYNSLLKTALQGNTAQNLIVVTDGELGHLPLETFLVTSAPAQAAYSDLHYLIKDYSISYNYSATLLKENRQNNNQRQHNQQMLALAASYHQTEKTPQNRTLRDVLVDLPAAREEVNALAQLFKGDFLLGNDANEAAFKQKAANYAVVHLAMHGLLNKKTPILSSLAFTEVQDSSQDGFLEAWEIAHLKLNADLVVLSACETGFGKFEQGEGVMSLARSFMYAGVPALVVSMWEVNDASTSAIMQLFYQNLATGQPKSKALQQAKISYLANTKGMAAHPAYWSPFVQLGDDSPIRIETQSGALLWWIIGSVAGLAALLVVRYFVMSRRAK